MLFLIDRLSLSHAHAHPPGVDAGAVAEQRPDDGDDAFLGREVEWRPALAILMNDVNVGDSQAILTSTALQNYFQNTFECSQME